MASPAAAAEPNPFDAYQDYGHSHFHNAMLWGDSLTNIGFTGSGTTGYCVQNGHNTNGGALRISAPGSTPACPPDGPHRRVVIASE
jgi:hypothetical protein